LLESAIARPYQTFGGENLYSNIFEKAAASAEV
jgi:prophage maintenance system killer protein